MAWASSGTTNAELASRLKANDVIRSAVVERAFRLVDRGLFLPEGAPADAAPYQDAPVRVGKVHMSAPHMYATVLEALDLSPGLSFCNIGSGAGYLSSLVSTIIGAEGVSHGLELEEEVVLHARKCVKKFMDNHNKKGESDTNEMKVDPIPICSSEFVAGNCFHLDTEASLKYDRVYIGAATELKWKEFFCHLVTLGGILVGPFGNNLIKLVKKGEKEFSVHTLARVQFAPLQYPEDKLEGPRPISYLPNLIWTPESHRKFPLQFKNAVITILLMERRKDSYGNPTGLPALLPKHLWFHILSFATRDWFNIPLTREQFLEKLLAQEIKAREEAERRAVKAEDARDRLMMAMYLRVQFGNNNNAGGGGVGTDDEDEDEEMEAAIFPTMIAHTRRTRTEASSSSSSSSSSPSSSSASSASSSTSSSTSTSTSTSSPSGSHSTPSSSSSSSSSSPIVRSLSHDDDMTV